MLDTNQYQIDSLYKSQITLDPSLTTHLPILRYPYLTNTLKAIELALAFTLKDYFQLNTSYNITGTDIVFTETPIQFNGVEYTTLFTRFGEEILLQQDSNPEQSDFDIVYLNDGQSVELKIYSKSTTCIKHTTRTLSTIL